MNIKTSRSSSVVVYFFVLSANIASGTLEQPEGRLAHKPSYELVPNEVLKARVQAPLTSLHEGFAEILGKISKCGQTKFFVKHLDGATSWELGENLPASLLQNYQDLVAQQHVSNPISFDPQTCITIEGEERGLIRTILRIDNRPEGKGYLIQDTTGDQRWVRKEEVSMSVQKEYEQKLVQEMLKFDSYPAKCANPRYSPRGRLAVQLG